ncbi:MAG TPA: esterase-like activity of phytase family protein, partial [Pseudomonadales bacterium]|nr:esterase-like activity of phytase family protein [Pseudomonadales bacterium]
KTRILPLCLLTSLTSATLPVLADPAFVNGLALSGDSLDLSGGTDANNGRLGYFSDIFYDAKRKHWWALSDRGPGGGTLNYDVRVQRFKLDIDKTTGKISNFKITQTLILKDEVGNPLNGLAPLPTNMLGNSFDPEGFVVHPKNGHFLVSDEYGPSLYEFDREGLRVRSFTIPSNLIPRNTATGELNFANDAGNDAGKRSNRGFEGLAISPDGDYVYAMLQSSVLDEGGSRGKLNRIVKFDYATGKALAQYAYEMKRSGQGQGISALMAINDHEFLVLERNNRGLGVGAELASPDKETYKIDISTATDVSNIDLDAPNAVYQKVSKSSPFINLAANTLDAIGNKVPEKWEGLAVGPQLEDGSYMMLAGTDNDYSVTQNGIGTQFDVYFNFSDADPYATSIQCPMGMSINCVATNNGTAANLTPDFKLLPAVLHAYRVPATDLTGFVPAVPPVEKN